MKFNKIKMMSLLLIAATAISSCSKYEADLPGVGDVPDKTPPEARFSYTPSDTDYLEITYTNESISSTDYVWDLDNGFTSTDKDVTVTYPGPGTYEVTLTSSDKLGKSSTVTQSVNIVEVLKQFEPEILNPSFDEEGDDSYRNYWRNSDLGGVIQITSSPVHSSPKAAKLPSAGDRVAYQLIKVEKNTDYVISFYYTMKESADGWFKVSILNGDVHDPSNIAGATIASVDLDDRTSADTYVLDSVSFNSGDSGEVAILVQNGGIECRIDSFTIVND